MEAGLVGSLRGFLYRAKQMVDEFRRTKFDRQPIEISI